MEISPSKIRGLLKGKLLTALRAYSRTVENRNWDALPPTYIRLNGSAVPWKMHTIFEQLAQAAGCALDMASAIYHDFVVQSTLPVEKQWKVNAEAEIQVHAVDSDMLLWRLPVTLELYVAGSQYSVQSAIYDGSRAKVERLTAWRRPYLDAVTDLRAAMYADQDEIPEGLFRGVARTLLPPIITIAIDDAAVDPCERHILEWAANKAVYRWNEVLQGCHRLLLVKGSHWTNILIEAIDRPIADRFTGVCYHRVSMRGYQRRADTLIRVLTTGSPDPTPFPRSPENVCHTVEHELGHALGLSDTPIQGSIMGRRTWNSEMPAPGQADGASVRRWSEMCLRCFNIARSRRSIPDDIVGWFPDLPSCIRREEIVSISRASSTLNSLLPQEHWGTRIWEGERLVRQHEWQRTIEAFAEAAMCAPDPSEALLRKHIVAVIYAPNPQPDLAALESALCSRQRGWEATGPAHLHNVLAYRYGVMGVAAFDELHTAQAEWLRAVSKVWQMCQWATESRTPRNLADAILPLLQAIQCGIQLLRCKVRNVSFV